MSGGCWPPAGVEGATMVLTAIRTASPSRQARRARDLEGVGIPTSAVMVMVSSGNHSVGEVHRL